MRRFLLVVRGTNGAIETHPMKDWLRRNPEHVPSGLDPNNNNSHQLRDGLRKQGWSVQQSSEEVRLVSPGVTEEQTFHPIPLEPPPGEEVPEPEEEFEFALESHLRDFIARNIHTICISGKRLRLYVDSSGRSGVEYPTPVGPIDILAIDGEGDLAVFKLKVGRGADRAMGQLLRYMGWVKSGLADKHGVSGIIVAKEVDEKLRYAASVIPNVTLLEYQVDFRLSTPGFGGAQPQGVK